MSDVLQLSGGPGWTAIGNTNPPDRVGATVTTQTVEPRQEAADATDDRVPPSASDAAGHTVQKLGRTQSSATPYLQYLTKLVQRVFLTPDRLGDPIRSVVFASVDPQKHASLLPAAAAELLASRVTGRVCLVDADFHRPSLHECYGVSNDIGLATALSSTGPVRSYARRLIQGHESSLWLLPSGASDYHGEALLASEAGQGRFRDLTAAFDYVVVAAPALTQRPVAAALGAHVDGLVMIAESQVTRRRTVQSCADAIRASGGRVLGTVLNNRTFPIPEAVFRLL